REGTQEYRPTPVRDFLALGTCATDPPGAHGSTRIRCLRARPPHHNGRTTGPQTKPVRPAPRTRGETARHQGPTANRRDRARKVRALARKHDAPSGEHHRETTQVCTAGSAPRLALHQDRGYLTKNNRCSYVKTFHVEHSGLPRPTRL